MTINKNNYEAYIIDYLEGNLTPALSEELHAFLAENPDIRNDMEDILDYTLPIIEKTQFQHKPSIKKTLNDQQVINQQTIDEWSIAFYENDLGSIEKERLQQAIQQQPALQKTFEQYKYTKVQPDKKVVYRNKRELKHAAPLSRILYFAGSIAAAAAIFIFALTFIVNSNNNESGAGTPLAEYQVLHKKVKNNIKPPVIVKEKYEYHNQIVKEPKHTNKISHNEKIAPIKPGQSGEKYIYKKLEPKQALIKAQHKSTIPNTIIAQSKIQHLEESITLIQKSEDNNLIANTLGEVLEFGITVFNKLNEQDITIQRNYNTAGKLESITVITDQRKITAPVI